MNAKNLENSINATLPPTPYYVLDEAAIVANMKIIARLCELSGAKALLALKCFATWGVFDVMQPYLHGTTSSSLNEVRLGYETFGNNADASSSDKKETHAYSVAYSADEIPEVLSYADKIIFNSISQLTAFKNQAAAQGVPVGLRLNPKTSNSSFLIADPARPFSRLGEHDKDKIAAVLSDITGVMIHNNCENDSFEAFSESLADIESRFGDILQQLEWVSLGGGIHFIAPDYPLEKLADRLKVFSETYGVQVYLEPGEASIHGAGTLVTTVLDTMHNQKNLAVVDASIEAHMLDLLIYRESAPIAAINNTASNIAPTGNPAEAAPSEANAESADHTIIYGRSCLAGDIFGEYALPSNLQIGDKIAFGNAAGYTMVKKNWFNGVNMPAIVIRRLDGSTDIQREFDYEEYKASLS
ncbi:MULTISPECIES: carboxynorspermidine decarboxylase [Psychrobacter]|jgi:carboxynorspermidine decarboxylase|uniref:carboxynorspermidine decarboxylase n=1 Tax=Psychrobacter TaxID=497 RepID=UPI000E82B60E|nr:carboxynorspermidine decarboxylase [Psychrobacter pacificensis]MED6315710.1 carboxynorspermidine decarboxylase [Pseudomonadota bacterium]HBL95993.1 carboxynorspermidine decarboxylase [Psychrobacter sp.]|tara:strand:+ start:618 stop:1859 length:1242 start_codon:yes stop_codon:yes gene_type:complete